jgi:thiol-disulfide isomerase/thioredoxin
MKQFLSAVISILICLVSYGQKDFYYKLNIVPFENKKINKIYVEYEIEGIKFTDSFNIGKKKFTIDKKLAQPVSAIIYTDEKKIGSRSVFLANNILNVLIVKDRINLNKYKLQLDFLFLTANDSIRPLYFPLYGELSSKNDTAGLNKLDVIFDSLKKDDIKKSYAYFKSNNTSLLSLFSFNRFTTFFADYSVVENDFQLLPRWAKNSQDGKAMRLKIEGAKSAQINTVANEFIQMSSTGEKVSLAVFKGKYVLLDFWASWCVPCRKEHPALIELYEKFRNNFEIISVSLDADKSDWLKAITADKINWTNISDLKGQQNEIAIQYGVQAVPANFLIDPKGIIIDRNITVEGLNEKLTTLLIR